MRTSWIQQLRRPRPPPVTLVAHGGVRRSKPRRAEQIDLGYLKYHDLKEQYHSQATLEELLMNFVDPEFDTENFLQGAENMLNDGVLPYI
ncbi:MAG: hypothetical protein ABGX22_12960 [Pirellulaceae bacterium]|nr:hypothetical protein [Planctomycetaceae bacterium]